MRERIRVGNAQAPTETIDITNRLQGRHRWLALGERFGWEFNQIHVEHISLRFWLTRSCGGCACLRLDLFNWWRREAGQELINIEGFCRRRKNEIIHAARRGSSSIIGFIATGADR
ncbi:hypothetical protein B6S59_18185 [Pseudomonas sp. A46]|nr:hypothetical protein B6S59_18185 [Pseudomonas sp. A46]